MDDKEHEGGCIPGYKKHPSQNIWVFIVSGGTHPPQKIQRFTYPTMLIYYTGICTITYIRISYDYFQESDNDPVDDEG